MKITAIIKSIISCLAFIFMTQAISSVSIYSLFIVAILYCAYVEINVKRNIISVVVSIILTALSIFYLINGSIDNISIIIKDIPTTLKTMIIAVGNYFFFENVVAYISNLINRLRRKG